MRKSLFLLLIFLLSGCSLFRWGDAAPTPNATDNLAVARFLTRAPVPAGVRATPTPKDTSFLPPKGLPLPPVEPLEVVGDLRVAGSSVLSPLTRQIYDRFVSAGYRDTMRIEEVSAEAVFQRYCTQTGEEQNAIDIVMAERSIRQSELEICQQHSRIPVALRVALAAVVVVTNAQADFVSGMNRSELATLMTATRWSDIRRSWPAAEISRFVPPAPNVMLAVWTTQILGENSTLLENLPAATFLEDGQEIAFAVADTPNAIGLLNFADYQRNPDGLRLLAVNGIAPNGVTVSNGTYVLVYPLLLYTDLDTLATRPQVGAFLLYYLSNMNALMNQIGVFPVNEALYERTKIVLVRSLGQDAYLEQFAPTSTPTLPPTATPVLTPTVVATSTVISTVTPAVTSTVVPTRSGTPTAVGTE
ncbi:MAG: substrate-binding domain-containing protein [Caldilineaceae bacterium]|nr:substrate-binding domain-containing protein [Caldilineaceae bacterium]